MKILHTADLHLKDKEHLSVLQAIIDLANKEQVELIIIAGDLFDMSANGRILEAAMLPIWEQFYGSVLIVPGNHDYKFLNNRTELAPNVVVAHQTPYSVAEIDGIYFVCVPYQKDISLSDIDIPLYEPSVLISHGTYEGGENSKYFPISATDLSGRYRYVAIGHYHQWSDRWVGGTCVVNPGSPRQTRKTDVGVRYVSILDTNAWLTERVVLPIEFVEYQKVSLSVTDSEPAIQEKLLRATAALVQHPFARIELSLQGTLVFSKYSLSERVDTWTYFLAQRGRNIKQITWDLTKLTQISNNVMQSQFTKLMVDQIAEISPEEVNDLAPFLFERLQHSNEKFID
ncbi:MAG: metallophosphoesterase family protein [Brevinema sp.]